MTSRKTNIFVGFLKIELSIEYVVDKFLLSMRPKRAHESDILPSYECLTFIFLKIKYKYYF